MYTFVSLLLDMRNYNVIFIYKVELKNKNKGLFIYKVTRDLFFWGLKGKEGVGLQQVIPCLIVTSITCFNFLARFHFDVDYFIKVNYIFRCLILYIYLNIKY